MDWSCFQSRLVRLSGIWFSGTTCRLPNRLLVIDQVVMYICGNILASGVELFRFLCLVCSGEASQLIERAP